LTVGGKNYQLLVHLFLKSLFTKASRGDEFQDLFDTVLTKAAFEETNLLKNVFPYGLTRHLVFAVCA